MPARSLIALFLAFGLLAAQQAGNAHAYTHGVSSHDGVVYGPDGGERKGGDGSLGHTCLDCLAFASFHAVAPGSTPTLGGAACSGFVPPVLPEGIARSRPTDRRSRAPPFSPEA